MYHYKKRGVEYRESTCQKDDFVFDFTLTLTRGIGFKNFPYKIFSVER